MATPQPGSALHRPSPGNASTAAPPHGLSPAAQIALLREQLESSLLGSEPPDGRDADGMDDEGLAADGETPAG